MNSSVDWHPVAGRIELMSVILKSQFTWGNILPVMGGT